MYLTFAFHISKECINGVQEDFCLKKIWKNLPAFLGDSGDGAVFVASNGEILASFPWMYWES